MAQVTLRKVVKTEKWQKDYIKRNLLTPTDWTGSVLMLRPMSRFAM